MISELISIVGLDNLQSLVAILLTGLVGKSSWDFYKSKEIAKKSDLISTGDALKNSINLINDIVSEVKDKHVKEAHDKLGDLGGELKRTNDKFSTSNENLRVQLQSEIDSLKKQLEQLKSESAKTSSRLDNESKALQSQLKDHWKHNEELNKKLDDFFNNLLDNSGRMSRAEIRRIREPKS